MAETAIRYEATATTQVGRKTVQKGATILLRPSDADEFVKGGAKLKKAVLAPHKVLRNLRHDGRGYAPNTTVNLHASDAAALIKSGVVEPLGAKPAADEAETK